VKYSFGSNTLGARESFRERAEYAENYSTGLSNHSFVNYWYEHMSYGRIDKNQNAIYPASSDMKAIPGDDPVSALNFVTDAYIGMQNDVKELIRLGTISSTGLSSKILSAKRGWKSPREDYFSYIRNMYSDLVFPFLSHPAINTEIVNFPDFVEQFTLFIDRITLLKPYTMTEYLLSNLSTPLYSGLAVEIDNTSDQGEDVIKIASYMNDVQFETYRQLAATRGFVLDKNAPWRFIAIPYSPQMIIPMGKYDVDYETLTEKFYKLSCFSDISDLKFYLKEFYNDFVRQIPAIRIPIIKGENRKRNLTRVVRRDIMTDEQYQEEWESDNAFWIRVYIYVRAKETNRDWNQYKFDQVSQKAAQFLQYSGETAAYKFINKEVKRPWGEDKVIKKYRRGNFRFQRK
jgi:hypothetical protein